MIAILVHWSIKKGRESEFESRWHHMTVESGKGLYRELLTTIDETVENPKFQTFSVADPHYMLRGAPDDGPRDRLNDGHQRRAA